MKHTQNDKIKLDNFWEIIKSKKLGVKKKRGRKVTQVMKRTGGGQTRGEYQAKEIKSIVLT